MIKTYKATAKLVSYSQPSKEFLQEGIEDLQDLVAYCARVSNPSNQLNTETTEKLLSYLAKHAHWSPFEMVSACVELTTTRDIARQLLRHRSMAFQEFCVSGDSLITTISNCGKTKKVKIEDLYKRYKNSQYWNMSDNMVRVYDELTKSFIRSKILEVFDTGIKPVYEMTLENGKKIKSTKEHKFLTSSGNFVELNDLSTNDFIACNGDKPYQNKEILLEQKQKSIQTGTGLLGVAEYFGVSYHTIRKWLRFHNIQYTKSEVASYTTIWNKNLPASMQPNYGKPVSDETREKMKKSAVSGKDSNLYVHGYRSWRKQVSDYWYKRKLELYTKFDKTCAITGKFLEYSDVSIDHILPVSQHPDLAYDESNIRIIHKDEHTKKSVKESSILVPKFSKILSIEYIGDEQTYDMEIDHTSHNYVANGIVTHNSQRYANPVKELNFHLREARLQDTKNRQNSVETEDELLTAQWEAYQRKVINAATEAYNWAINNGIAKEQARVVLPEGNTESKLYVNGTIRSFIHYIQVRSGNGTQKEHIELAVAIANVIAEVYKDVLNYKAS